MVQTSFIPRSSDRLQRQVPEERRKWYDSKKGNSTTPLTVRVLDRAIKLTITPAPKVDPPRRGSNTITASRTPALKVYKQKLRQILSTWDSSSVRVRWATMFVVETKTEAPQGTAESAASWSVVGHDGLIRFGCERAAHRI